MLCRSDGSRPTELMIYPTTRCENERWAKKHGDEAIPNVVRYLTFTASKMIASPSALAGTLYSPNASCGMDDPFGKLRVGSAMMCKGCSWWRS